MPVISPSRVIPNEHASEKTRRSVSSGAIVRWVPLILRNSLDLDITRGIIECRLTTSDKVDAMNGRTLAKQLLKVLRRHTGTKRFLKFLGRSSPAVFEVKFLLTGFERIEKCTELPQVIAEVPICDSQPFQHLASLITLHASFLRSF
jgi:hypothetical protein